MTFEEFQKQARLYVVGALNDAEIKQFQQTRKEFGQKADDLIRKCNDLSHAFALSLRPAKSTVALKRSLMSMVLRRQEPG